MKLIDNWKNVWRWYSTWAFASIATIQTSVLAFITPAQLESAVLFYPSMTWGAVAQAVTAFLAVTGGVGRLISQAPKAEE